MCRVVAPFRIVAVLVLLCSAVQVYGKKRDVFVDSLMSKVYHYADSVGRGEGEFYADLYAQCGIRTHRRNVFIRWVPGVFRFERGVNCYFGESRMRLHRHSDGVTDVKEQAYYSTMPRLHATNRRMLRRVSPSIYSTTFFDDRILSPLHRRNRRYYTYTYLSCFEDSLGMQARISIRPKFYNTQLVAGDMNVDMQTGAVRHFSFRVYYDMTRVQLSGALQGSGRASLFPNSLSITARYGMLGNKLEEKYLAQIDYSFPEIPTDTSERRYSRFDLTSQYLLRVDTMGVSRSRTYFDSVRQRSLSAEAVQLYARADSMARCALEDSASVLAQMERSGRKRIADFFFGRHTFLFNGDTDAEMSVRLPALFTPEMFTWSERKGFMLQTRLRVNVGSSDKFRGVLRPKASYSFKERRLYWRIPLTMDFWPQWGASVRAEAGTGNRLYSSMQADAARGILQEHADFDELSRLLNAYDFNFYRDFYVLNDFSVSPVAGLRLGLGIRYHRRSLVGWGEVAEQIGMRRVLSSLAPRFHAEWTPCQYYYRQGKRKVPVRSKWPTFSVDYERGLRMNGMESQYERVEAAAQWTRNLYALRAFYCRLGLGFYTDRGGNYFLDYDYFRDDNLPDTWRDAMSGKFYALGSRWYNESDYYLSLSATYESPMLLFSRFALLSRVVQRERLYLNAVHLRELRPYAELGYGISTHMLDVSGFVGLAAGKTPSVGARLVFHWFDDW